MIDRAPNIILKLTPQSQYGISRPHALLAQKHFEVDSTESVWYIHDVEQFILKFILKLTPQSQYGINAG